MDSGPGCAHHEEEAGLTSSSEEGVPVCFGSFLVSLGSEELWEPLQRALPWDSILCPTPPQ